MADAYTAYNGPMVTTAPFVPVTTGTALKTLLQIATPTTRPFRVIEWGISFDGYVAAAPIRCELVQVDVAATVTAHVASGVQPYSDPNAPASLAVLGVSATGYSATAEGTPTVSRYGDVQQIPPSGQYLKQYPLGREFEVAVGRFLRVRVLAPAAANAVTYVVWEE